MRLPRKFKYKRHLYLPATDVSRKTLLRLYRRVDNSLMRLNGDQMALCEELSVGNVIRHRTRHD